MPHSTDLHTTSLAALASAGQRVVLLLDGPGFDLHSEFPAITGYSDMIRNSYANAGELTAMAAYNADRLQEFSTGAYAEKTALYKISWTLTPQAANILGSIIPGNPNSLRTLAAKATPALPAFLGGAASGGQRPGHILIIDFHETSQIVELLTAMNG